MWKLAAPWKPQQKVRRARYARHCICGGINHGKGLEQAREQTRELAQEQIKAIEAPGGYVTDEARQLVLLRRMRSSPASDRRSR
jgi:hypothetical protein